MLRKQNKLLSHSLNNQSIPVLVRVCGLLTPVDNVDVQYSPTVIAHLPSYRGTPATSLWEFRGRLSSFMVALAGVACLACADCQPEYLWMFCAKSQRSLLLSTIISVELVLIRAGTSKVTKWNPLRFICYCPYLQLMSQQAGVRIIIPSQPDAPSIFYTISRGSSDKF